MDGYKLSQLNKKLEALNYKEPLQTDSAPLVDKLVTDLLHTTDSYRDLKLQVARQSQNIADSQHKVHFRVQPSHCWVPDFNQNINSLHAGADAADKADREHYQQVKKLEGQITELACWKHQTSGRFQTLEQENAGLRAKVEEILRLGEKYPRQSKPASSASAALPQMSLLKTADDRVAALEADMHQKQQSLTQLHEQLETLQGAVKRRDAEIQRLALKAEKGPDANQMNLRFKNETNESIILQLNSQVDFMTTQMTEMQREVDDKQKMEAAFKAAEQARKEAEMKLRGAVEENNSITQDIASMKMTLMKLQTERLKAGGKATHEVDAALAKVIDLKGELANSKAGQAAIKQAVDSAAKEHAAGVAREKALKSEVRELQSLLDRSRSQHDSLQRQVADQNGELDALRASVKSSRVQLASTQQELDRVKAELRTQTGSFQDMQAERELAQTELIELRQKLKELHSAASVDHLAKVDLESQQYRLQDDTSRLEKRLAAAEADRESLGHQLKDAVHAKGRASAALQQAQQQLDESKEHLTLLKRQLAEERQAGAASSANLDCLQAELAHCKTQITVLNSEKEVLEEAAASAKAKVHETREAMAAQAKQLGQLQYLPPRLQDMQEQVREYMDRMVKADGEASKAQTDATKAQKALRQLEMDVDALRQDTVWDDAVHGGLSVKRLRGQLMGAECGRPACRRSLDQAEVEKSKVSEKLLDAQHEILHLKSSLESWESKAKHASNDRETAQKQVAELQERLDAQGSSAQQSSQAIRAIEHRTAALQRQMQVKDEDLESLRQQLAESQQTAEALRGSGVQARAQAQEYGERARRAETLNQELSADLASLRAEQERLKHKARQAEDHVTGLRRQLDDRSREVEQLTTLSLKGDATLQEYMAQLTRVSSQARAAELHSTDVQAELRHQQEVAEERDAEIRRLHMTVEAIDSERDNLQAELDSKAEQIANLTEELELGHQQADGANRQAFLIRLVYHELTTG
ncbi:Centrosomal protein 135kDa, isoform B [Trebouxia sp. C0009 RCD-2024]